MGREDAVLHLYLLRNVLPEMTDEPRSPGLASAGDPRIRDASLEPRDFRGIACRKAVLTEESYSASSERLAFI